MNSRLVIILNNYKEVTLLEKEGGSTLPLASLQSIMALCEKMLPTKVSQLR